MNAIKNRLLQRVKASRYKNISLPRQFRHENVPYFSQWESPELVGKILTKEVDAKDDLNWKNSGAQTKVEYEDWSWAGCGMACTKMILAYATDKVVPLVELAKNALGMADTNYRLKLRRDLFINPI